MRELFAAEPGTIAGPCFPPFSNAVYEAMENSLAGEAPPWQEEQY